jgi:hypothetical protein
MSMKDSNIPHVFILLFIFTVAFTFSCNKIKLDKLEDTWQVTKISEIYNVDTFELWDFENGELTRITKINDSTQVLDTIDVCEYSVKSSYVTIKRCSILEYNGDWKIKKLKSNLMILINTRDNGFMYREFEKY